MCTFEEAERRERQLIEEYDNLIQVERDAESRGKELLNTDEWRNDKDLAQEFVRTGQEIARLKQARDHKLRELWKECMETEASNNGGG